MRKNVARIPRSSAFRSNGTRAVAIRSSNATVPRVSVQASRPQGLPRAWPGEDVCRGDHERAFSRRPHAPTKHRMASTAPDRRSTFHRPGPIAQVRLLIRRNRAGTRPQAVFDCRAREWRRAVRPTALAASSIPLASVAIVCLAVQSHGHGFLWGFGAGSSAAMYIACLQLAIPDHIDYWRRGADGEKKTAWRLRRLERQGWIVHHSVMAQRGDRDHIVVGPRGVFLLDSKQRRGRVTVHRGALVVQQHHSDRPAKPEELSAVCKARARELAIAISARTRYRPYVQTAIVIWGDFPQISVESEDVTFVHGDHLTSWLESTGIQRIPEWLVPGVIQAVEHIAQTPELGRSCAAKIPSDPVRLAPALADRGPARAAREGLPAHPDEGG
jgi:hypothetical protein